MVRMAGLMRWRGWLVGARWLWASDEWDRFWGLDALWEVIRARTAWRSRHNQGADSLAAGDLTAVHRRSTLGAVCGAHPCCRVKGLEPSWQ